MSGVHVVWFKRDLRVHDHAPLLAAAASGAPVLPLYIFEPGYWAQPEHSRRQFDFLIDSLRELDAALEARGSRLVVRTGHATDVLSAPGRHARQSCRPGAAVPKKKELERKRAEGEVGKDR